MKFLVITFCPIVYKNNKMYSYGPYVKEMNIWNRHVEEVIYICPEWKEEEDMLISDFEPHPNFTHIRVPWFDVKTFSKKISVALQTPSMCWKMFKAMRRADHIHLRCPTNVAVLGCFIQILFPRKTKTAKYAGNWDPHSNQPKSYRLQRWLVRNTFLTKNMKVLVYGKWPDDNKNILPFYTASYSEKEIIETPTRPIFNRPLKLLYVGGFMPSKHPLTSIKVCQNLNQQGFQCHLDMYGEGSEEQVCKDYIEKNNLQNEVTMHGNQPGLVVKQAFQNAHFLVFISRSEGWPKVVAESMFWGCVPITTNVSCVAEMTGNGTRGKLVANNMDEILGAIKFYLQNPADYQSASQNGMQWSRQYTLERFENDIQLILKKQHPAYQNL